MSINLQFKKKKFIIFDNMERMYVKGEDDMPLISVVMPVYNKPVKLLEVSVDSILDQTFKDFEFLIVDDGSTGETTRYLNGLTDPRIRIIRNHTNLGITKSLNIGFREAKGKYIARMDGGDKSLPDRFEKQLVFMESNPDVIVCGSSFGIGYSFLFTKSKLRDMENYRIQMLFMNPGPIHPTAFFRREELLRHNIEYNENLKYSQDYGMWMTVSQYGNIRILPDKLIILQSHGNGITKSHREEQIKCDKMTQKEMLYRLVDSVTEKELDIHYRYSTGYHLDLRMTDEARKWYKKLIKANDQKGIYDHMKFRKYVYLIMICSTVIPWLKAFINLFRRKKQFEINI